MIEYLLHEKLFLQIYYPLFHLDKLYLMLLMVVVILYALMFLIFQMNYFLVQKNHDFLIYL